MCQSQSEQQWMNEIRSQFAQKLQGANVLDIGSANLNGTYKPFFSQAGCASYTGIDVLPWDNVDIVVIAHEYKTRKKYGIVFSASQLEHDIYYQKTLMKMIDLCNSGGMIIFSTWSNFERHGVADHEPETSLTSQLGNEWSSYYQNLTIKDIKKVWTNKILKRTFSDWWLGMNPHDDHNVVFWGIKKWKKS